VRPRGCIEMSEEPLFFILDEDDPEYQASIDAAQNSLPRFRSLLAEGGRKGVYPSIKAVVIDGDEGVPLWLANVIATQEGFRARVFEVPPECTSIRLRDWVDVPADAVLDWMVTENGRLHGGFSLRYQRSRLPPEKRPWFDSYIGVTAYE
jgi:uncharacterized protein YegJ (DUF2314 family)